MTKSHRLLLVSLLISLLIPLIVAPPAHAQTTVGFGTGMVLLAPPDDGMFFEGTVSPSGEFAAGTVIYDNSLRKGNHLYLWDLRAIDRHGDAVKAEPLKSFDLSVNADSFFDKSHIAFSPVNSTSQRLAVFSRQDILVLSIPDFELLAKIPVDSLNHMSQQGALVWSQDGHLLALNHASGLMVWDGSHSHTFAYSDAQFYSGIRYFMDGWLVTNQSSFMFCTQLLDSCQRYDGAVTALNDAEQMVISDSDDLPAMAWTQDKHGIFQQKPYSSVDGILSSFSPDGEYNLVMRMTEGKNPNYPYYILYKGPQPLYNLDSFYNPIWLGTSDYFVQGNSLYHPDQAKPLDTTDDLHFEGITDADLGIWPEYLGGESVSSDGCWYMQILGKTAVVTPLNLPDCPTN